VNDLPKAYNPSEVEKKWVAFWMKEGLFHAEPKSGKKTFTMVIPPPNITGILHMGHALNNTLQDILARYKRMCGFEVLWLPGTDHAGIATQNVVDKNLREQGKDRRQLGREKFVKLVWKWREEYGNTIVEQLKRLGCSCDWERLRFTMDEGLSEAVREAFIRLYDKGLIYRDRYIINWCPSCRTALSDEEVTHKEMAGHLYHIRYALENSQESVIIATTRPETLLGDTAVGFHPDDKRYQRFHEKTLILPLLGRRLRTVLDKTIRREFGTGALKITPAHDPVDFQLGKKHGLESINILNPDGTLNENAGPYQGLDRFKAREKVIEDLKTQGLMTKIDDHSHAIGHCYRCLTIVEPYLSDQWFVRMKPLAEPALAAVRKKKIRFHPDRWTKVYLDWMENIRDWCISRQIWWGHRIPVYYGPDGKHTAARDEKEARRRLKLPADAVLRQDEDVLDTWFSSWLWPFSTLGWPSKSDDLHFYPTQTLVTGYEIIFFWVARMVMAGFEFMNKEPFGDIYIHGIVRDSKGVKMSKSLGNIVDPLEIIDEFGTDALRFSIISITSEGQDVYASKERFELGRNFANKIWNASRFTLLNLKGETPPKETAMKNLLPPDRWILSRLNRLTERVTQSLDGYRFNETAGALYEFVWHEFCDWYLELIKPHTDTPSTQWTLRHVLQDTLKLLHPFMPFLTEEISSRLGRRSGSVSLMTAPWPVSEKAWRDDKIEEEIGALIRLIQAIRNARSEWKVPPKEQLSVLAKTAGKKEDAFLETYSHYLKRLARVGSLEHGPHIKRPPQSVNAAVGRIEAYLSLAGVIDVQRETKRMNDALENVQKLLLGLKKKLGDRNFIDKAPKKVVERERERQKEYEDRRKRLENNLSVLKTS